MVRRCSVSFPIEEYALEALLAAAQCLSGKSEKFRCPIEPVFWCAEGEWCEVDNGAPTCVTYYGTCYAC